MSRTDRVTGNVLEAAVDVIDWRTAVDRVVAWSARGESRCAVAANVHVVVSAWRDPVYRGVINAADLVLPDGAPVAWLLRCQGHADQTRISGPDLMWMLLERCAREGVAVYLFGSTEATLRALAARVRQAFPALAIAGAESPPFRSLTADEDRGVVERINASGAGVLFVGLGCPKQEHWIIAHRGRINAVMLGVGAAFDFHAGSITRAPRWMRDHGLEWLHRLLSEPRRLWKRYLVTNTLFLLGAAGQLLRARKARSSA